MVTQRQLKMLFTTKCVWLVIAFIFYISNPLFAQVIKLDSLVGEEAAFTLASGETETDKYLFEYSLGQVYADTVQDLNGKYLAGVGIINGNNFQIVTAIGNDLYLLEDNVLNPNPFQSIVKANSQQVAKSGLKLKISSLEGKEGQTFLFSGNEVDLGSLPDGAYMAELFSSNQKLGKTYKLIKQK